MKTLIRLVKDCDKNIVFMEPTAFFKYLLENQGNPFDLFSSFCWTAC